MKDEWNDPIESKQPISIDDEGCVVVGSYLCSSEITQRDSSGRERKSNIHTVVIAIGTALAPLPMGGFVEGDECRFWGSYDLDDKLRRVSLGVRVRVAYIETRNLSGGRTMKVFEVRTAKGSSSSSSSSPSDSTGDSDERNPPPPETPF